MKIKRYYMKPDTTEETLRKHGFKDGGSWISPDSKLYKTVPLVGSIELNIGYASTENWNDFNDVCLDDDDFGQPYTPFYGDNYGKDILNFEFLEKVITAYNKAMDGFDFLERQEVDLENAKG